MPSIIWGEAMAYNKKIEIQYYSENQDEIGNDIPQWTTLIRPWAEVNCTGGREYYAAAQVNSENDMIFKIRYSSCMAGKLTSDLRIVYNGLIYNVKHIDDFMEQHRELVIRARQLNGGVNDEQ